MSDREICRSCGFAELDSIGKSRDFEMKFTNPREVRMIFRVPWMA